MKELPLVTYWNAWTANYSPDHDGYITHAVEEPSTRGLEGTALCGVECIDFGGMEIPQETEPGCMRCRAILRRRGVIE